MFEVASINRGKFLGSYCDDARKERIPDQVYFAAGVLLSLGLSQFIFGVYGGATVVTAFAGSAAAGVVWGLVKYLRGPYQFPPVAGNGFAARRTPGKVRALKNAA